jgi:hypothetical protein
MKQQLPMIGFRERALKSVDTQKQSELLNVYTMANAFREELVENVPWNSRTKMNHEIFMQSLYFDKNK